MGKVIIQEYTTKEPLSLMGAEAGICWGANTEDKSKNYKRGLGCLNNGHGRVSEYPQVYMILDGYSARVIREFYTHISGGPTRLQASTRYINYDGFTYITPQSIMNDPEAISIYEDAISSIRFALCELEAAGIPREDSANLLPLGMTTKVVVRTNLRNLIDMSHQRLCTRAYWEYRELMTDIMNALSAYSEEWATIVKQEFQPKCELFGYCSEDKGCGRKPKKE
jgi:thymidylate synthase (FAD)